MYRSNLIKMNGKPGWMVMKKVAGSIALSEGTICHEMGAGEKKSSLNPLVVGIC
jgi:hypothetical protein